MNQISNSNNNKIEPHYRLLKKEIIKEITDKKYNEEQKTFELKGFNLPFSNNSITNQQEEKRLQWLVNHQLEILLNEKIKEENWETKIDKDTCGYILKDILLEQIKNINDNNIKIFLIENPTIKYIEIIDYIYNDFLDKYNKIRKENSKNKNIKLHKLFFNDGNGIQLIINGKNFEYRIIDFKIPKNNKITIIREKKLLIESTWQLPDFAIYFNGLPFIVIEMKATIVNGLNGTQEALNDYRTKSSYHNFLGCLGTNGKQTFFSSNPFLSDFFIWENYENNQEYLEYYENIEDRNGLWDFINDIIINPTNMLFYFDSCTMISEDGLYLKSARVQQFKTALKFNNEFKHNKNKIENYFQHHTRTGKSFTFKIITKLAWKKYNNRFKKVLFFTHDVSSVLPTVEKEFKNLNFPNKNGGIQVIESKNEYLNLLSNPVIFGAYIVNMQKIAKNYEIIDNSSEILILIDEVHTHQGSSEEFDKETMADFRKKHFPNASIIAATASPLIKEIKDNQGNIKNRNITEENFGKCIDKLTPSDAIRLNLVTKLHYEKINYKSNNFEEMFNKIKQVEKIEKEEIIKKILSSIDNLKEHIKQKTLIQNNKLSIKSLELFDNLEINNNNFENIINENYFKENLKINLKKLNDKDIKDFEELLENLRSSLNSEYDKVKQSLKSEFEKTIWEVQLKDKIEHIVIVKMKELQETTNNKYKVKGFYVVPNLIENGKTMLKVIKTMIQEYIDNDDNYDKTQFNVENNIYKGIRFGFDNEEQDTIIENGYIPNGQNPTTIFEMDEIEFNNNNIKIPTKPIDVLILVRKKLMGYDNKNLGIVFLDKRISQENIKEMLQLATRGTTKRDGKEIGILVDLTIDDNNILTYKKAFSIYDNKDNVEEFLLDENKIDECINKLKNSIKNIENLFKDENQNQDLTKENINKNFIILKNKYWLWKQPKNIEEQKIDFFITNYINEMKFLEENYKKLLQPSYVLKSKNEKDLYDKIMFLFYLNSKLLEDIKNKLLNVYKRKYTSEDIIEILENTFATFGGVKEFIGKFNITYKNNEFISTNNNTIEDEKKIKISSKVSKLLKDLKKLTNNDNSNLSSSLEKIQSFIDTNENSIDEEESELFKIENLLEEQKKERKIQIDRYFEGNENIFEIFISFEKCFKQILGQKYSNILKIYSEELDKVLIRKANEISTIGFKKSENIKSLIEKIDITSFNDGVERLKDEEKEILIKNFDGLLGPNGCIENTKKELIKEIENSVELDFIDNKIINFAINYI